MSTEYYENPLITRYTSREMAHNFSSDVKFSTWRTLWIALAEAEMELGLPITQEQIDELKEHQFDINYEDARKREKETRHDVMSHVYAYGLQCPKAKGIIHLGATSAYVGDNTDIIQMRDGLKILQKKLAGLLYRLSRFALEYKDLPTLGFTHFQAAQLTTVGKRATLWMQDLYFDYQEVTRLMNTLPMLGVKGTTGTQASFVDLFDGDLDKVKELDRRVAEKMGFDRVVAVSGQTYTRKLDYMVLSALSGIGQSLHKMTNDIRLLQHMKEVEEPFEKSQIGSSAMAYKRNPMRSERVASLARYVINMAQNPADTASTQWFERTLDDSANRRMAIPESFMACDAIVDIATNICTGLVVREKVIHKHIMEEIPFMATENIMMEAVKRGGDRQELHEKIRELSMIAGNRVKEEGLDNNLLELIAAEPLFGLSMEDVTKLLNPSDYIGRSPQQVTEFVEEYLEPLFEEHREDLVRDVQLFV